MVIKCHKLGAWKKGPIFRHSSLLFVGRNREVLWEVLGLKKRSSWDCGSMWIVYLDQKNCNGDGMMDLKKRNVLGISPWNKVWFILMYHDLSCYNLDEKHYDLENGRNGGCENLRRKIIYTWETFTKYWWAVKMDKGGMMRHLFSGKYRLTHPAISFWL